MDDEHYARTELRILYQGDDEEVGMSVAAQVVHEAGLTPEQAEELGIPMSWDEYEALGEAVRGEYIGGRLYVNAFPTSWHQMLCLRLCRQLEPQLAPGTLALTGIGWKPAADEFGPDVIVLPLAGFDLRSPRFTGMPLLVAEVLSSNANRDAVVKAYRYAKVGLPQYWIVDPEGVLEVMVLGESGEGPYRLAVRLTDSEGKVLLPDGTEVAIDAKELFAG